jgi:hypothetical protein
MVSGGIRELWQPGSGLEEGQPGAVPVCAPGTLISTTSPPDPPTWQKLMEQEKRVRRSRNEKEMTMVLAPCTSTLCTALHPAPCTLYRYPPIVLCAQHCILHPASCILHPAPCTLHPAPCTLHQYPVHCTLHPAPIPSTSTLCTALHPAPVPVHSTLYSAFQNDIADQAVEYQGGSGDDEEGSPEGTRWDT